MLHSGNSYAALPSDLKYSNRMQVLEVFKAGDSYTANDISRQIGLSRQTVMKAIQFFTEKGIIVPVGKGDSSSAGGKRPVMFSLASDKYFLCVSVWPSELRFVILDLRFHDIDHLTLPQPLSPDLDEIVQQVGSLSVQLLQKNNISSAQLCGVSISTPGIVDYAECRLRFNSLSPEWGSNIPLAEKLQPYFAENTPILIENVAKMTARALLHKDHLQDKRLLVLFSSWGLSGCLIEKDRILNGHNSLIGEIGHMILSPDDSEQCGCGCYGCFERLVSDQRLRKNAAAQARDFPNSVLLPILDKLTVQDVFAASAQGDAFARVLVAKLARYFAIALHNITLDFNPDLVVFQGAYADADQYFRDQLTRALMEFQYYPSSGPFQLQMDRRSIEELDLQGSYTLLLDAFFSDTALYE